MSTTSAQGRRVVMLTQPGMSGVSRSGINIVHPSTITTATTPATTVTTAGTKFQLVTRPYGTSVLTHMATTSPQPQVSSSMRVALEGGEGGTRLISISSPSRAHQAAADSLTSLAGSLLGNNSTSPPTSMVGTPLLEARTANIRTSIVDSVLTTSATPIVISPPDAGLASKARTVSMASMSSAVPGEVVEGSSLLTPSAQAQQLLDIRQHLNFRSDMQPAPKQTQTPIVGNEGEREAELDLGALSEEDPHPEEFRITPKRGRGSRGGRGRGGRGRGRGGRGRGGRGRGGRGRGLPGTVMEELAPEDVYSTGEFVVVLLSYRRTDK